MPRVRTWQAVLILVTAFSSLVCIARADEKPDPNGTWKWDREIQGQTSTSVLKLKRSGDKLAGTYRRSGDEVDIEDARIEGNKLSFQITREFNDRKFVIRFLGTLKEDKIDGTVTLAAGDQTRELDWRAARSLEVADVVGNWQFKISTDNGQTLTPSIQIDQQDQKLTGVYASRFGEFEAKDVKIKGLDLTFTIAGEAGDNAFSFIYRGQPRGDSIKGTIAYDLRGRKGSIEFEGQRKSERPPEAKQANEGDTENTADEDEASAAAKAAADVQGLLGRKIETFTLKDYRGKTHSLSDYAKKSLVVLYFMGTECPLAKLYGPRMQKLADEFGSQSVAFLGVSSNVQDSITELAGHARVHNIGFPILKDLSNKVADELGATRTPQVFVLDAKRAVRYYGRVDAQFTFGAGVGLAQPQDQRRDLAIALQELLAGEQVSVPVTEAKGCLIGRVLEPNVESAVTYTNQIARLIQSRCLECHRQGQIAPFAMTEYAEVAGWGEMIAEVVREQRMPPWHANPAHGRFSNENRLTAAEQQLIYAWVENGCPQGDPADLPEPRKFKDQWFLPREPDRIVYLGDEPVQIKAEGVDPYRYYRVDPGFKEDTWVEVAECRPGNRAVVHHIIVYVRPPEQAGARSRNGDRGIADMGFLAGFAPGTRPLVAPKGWAKKIPAGSEFVFEMHYTPIGTPQTDRSSIAMIFMDEKDVTHQMATANAVNRSFNIPPREPNFKVEANKTFRADVTLLSLFPHMHMRGKSFHYELTYPDGKQETLLDVPRYDFNWQNSYIFAEPKLIPKGSRLHCTAYFDNSQFNLANPDPDKTVRWGPQTWEEMMIGWYDIGLPVAEAQALQESEKAAREEGAE